MACDFKAGNAGREPNGSCRESSHDVAEVVDPEVQPTEPDRNDERRGGGDDRHPGAAALRPERHDHVREHPIADQPAQHVTTRETERIAVKEGRAVEGAGTLDDALEGP